MFVGVCQRWTTALDGHHFSLDLPFLSFTLCANISQR